MNKIEEWCDSKEVSFGMFILNAMMVVIPPLCVFVLNVHCEETHLFLWPLFCWFTYRYYMKFREAK